MNTTIQTTRIDSFARVTVADHACCRRMAWESPRVIFCLDDGRELVWHSDQVGNILHRHGIKHGCELVGKEFALGCLVRGDRVWRVDHISPME